MSTCFCPRCRCYRTPENNGPVAAGATIGAVLLRSLGPLGFIGGALLGGLLAQELTKVCPVCGAALQVVAPLLRGT